MVLGTPKPLEDSLVHSGIYTTLVDSVIQEKQAEIGSDVPLDQPEVQAAIKKAFPPSLIESQVNRVIDGTYAWAQGKQQSPSFTLDLAQAQNNLATYIGSYATQRAANLRICTTTELRTMPPNVDPYTAVCRPAYVTPETVGERAKLEILASQLFKQGTFSTDSIDVGNGKTLTERLSVVPQAYKWTIWTMYLTGIFALVSIGLILWLRWKNLDNAIKHISRNLLSTGILSAVLAWAVGFSLHVLESFLAKNASNTTIQSSVIAIVRELALDLRGWWLGYGITLIVIGIAGLIIRRFVKAQPQAHSTSSTHATGQAPILPKS